MSAPSLVRAILVLCAAAVPGCSKSSPTSPDPALPDLVLSAASLSTATVPASGGSIAYCFTFQNIGATAPGTSTFDVAAYFSTDATLDAADPVWTGGYSRSDYQLTAGFSREICASNGLGNTPPASGQYYVIFKVDALPHQPPNFLPGVIEANENNNWRATSTRITIQP